MQALRILFILLVLSVTGCAQIIQSRLSSARGTIYNEKEQLQVSGKGASRVFILADLMNEEESIKSENNNLSSSLYNTLSKLNYPVRQFEPESKAELNQYLPKLEAELKRDPSLLVVRLIPKSMRVKTEINKKSVSVPQSMNFVVYAYTGTLRSPAYVYTGDWLYEGDFYLNAMGPAITERLIKAGYLAKKSD